MTANKILCTNNSKKSSNFCKAKSLDKKKRKEIALLSLSEKKGITELSKKERVSRKFIYEQKEKAISAINKAFVEENRNENEKVLFTIEVQRVG